MADGATTTVGEARAYIEENLDEGVECPCCGQYARRYRRRLSSGVARWLIHLVTSSPKGEWVHTARCIGAAGKGGSLSGTDAAYLLNIYGMLEAKPNDDGAKRRSGYWRPTEKGRRFAMGLLRVPKYVVVALGQVEGFDGDLIDIRGALGKRFDYAELMGLRRDPAMEGFL